MTKIVFNACHGGFALSYKAIQRGRALSANPTWGERFFQGPRHDPVLVLVTEELGREAGGRYSDLRIAEVPSGSRYRIVEYDGLETVETPDSYKWEEAP